MKQLLKKLTSLFLITLLIIGTASFAFADTNAKIYISGDDAYRVYVNGEKVGEDWQTGSTDERNWSDIEIFDVTLTDDFIIAIEAVDLFGTIAGVSANVVMNDGTTFDILNNVWQVSTSVNSNWKTEKLYSSEDDWHNVTQVTPHASWPSAGNWGWTQNAEGSNLTKNAFFKYYVPKPVILEGTVNVYHYLTGTTTFMDSLDKAVTQTGVQGAGYTTSPLNLSGYTVTTPLNATGTYSANPVDVIYYYTAIPVTPQPEPETTQPNPQPTTQPETTQPNPQPTPQPQPQPQGPTGTVQIVYVDELGNSLTPTFQFSGEIGTNYSTSSKAFDGYTLIEMPANANGSFTSGTTVVSYVYSNDAVVIEDEEVALGESTAIAFDTVLPVDSTEVVEETAAVAEEILLDEATPLADALPKTGQLPVELFYGIGGLISAAGVFLRRKI